MGENIAMGAVITQLQNTYGEKIHFRRLSSLDGLEDDQIIKKIAGEIKRNNYINDLGFFFILSSIYLTQVINPQNNFGNIRSNMNFYI